MLGCGPSDYTPLNVVERVDVQRYIRKWYEIANLTNSFRKGCNCTTSEFHTKDVTLINKKEIELIKKLTINE